MKNQSQPSRHRDVPASESQATLAAKIRFHNLTATTKNQKNDVLVDLLHIHFTASDSQNFVPL
jgi:hypothetical protein